LDGNDPLRDFCTDLEAACVQVIDVDGVMTKDLALAIHGRQMKREHWVVTDVYLDAVNVRFFLPLEEVASCLLIFFSVWDRINCRSCARRDGSLRIPFERCWRQSSVEWFWTGW
jgi:hypothetical protein